MACPEHVSLTSRRLAAFASSLGVPPAAARPNIVCTVAVANWPGHVKSLFLLESAKAVRAKTKLPPILPTDDGSFHVDP